MTAAAAKRMASSSCVPPGPRGGFPCSARDGARVMVHTLTEAQSLRFARVPVWGGQRIVLSDSDIFESDGALVGPAPGGGGRARGDPRAPGAEAALRSDGFPVEPSPDGVFSLYRLAMPAKRIELAVRRENDSIAEVSIPPGAFEGVRDVILSIDYDGDVGHAFINRRLIADNSARCRSCRQ